MKISRRDAVLSTLFGAGLVGLRSLASGVPAALLLNPERALAQSAGDTPKKPQFLIFSTSFAGDPSSCNVPGTYDDANIFHASAASMAATDINLGGGTVRKGAQIWSTLPAAMLSRTSFFHHSTYTLIHVDEIKVLRMMGATANGEMLPSLISRQLQSTLGTVRSQPISLGGNQNEAIYCNGAPQPLLRPTTLASVLASPKNGLGTMPLEQIRNDTLDKLNAFAKSRGKTAQSDFLDKYATSRSQLKTLQQNLLAGLSAIKADDQDSQIQAALVLFQMKVTPSVVVHIDFGGDNHFDDGLQNETDKHTSGVATLSTMWKSLTSAGLQDQVTFCMMNVFGRSLYKNGNANNEGRSHNNLHNTAIMIGPGIKGSVIGGVALETKSKEFQALPIISATGAGDATGDIPYTETLGAVAKTLATACGVSSDAVEANVFTGKAVPAALAT